MTPQLPAALEIDLSIWSMVGYDLILIATVAILTSLAMGRLLIYAKNKLPLRKNQSWLLALLETANLPLQFLIWSLTLLFCIDVISPILPFKSDLGLVANLRQVALITALMWLIMRWKRRIEIIILETYVAQTDLYLQKALVAAVARLASILIALTALVMVLHIFDVSLSTLLAFGGAGALASGLAAKDIVANLFGGMMIFVTRPFGVGDWIKSPDKDLEGTVTDIGWYMTCIRSLDRRPIYVPNALFSSLVLINPTRMSHRRLKHTIGVRYDDFHHIEEITKKIESYLHAHREIDASLPLFVKFSSFGDYALNISVYAFSKSTHWKHWREVEQEVLLEIGRIIERCGAQMAFPTQSLHIISHEEPS